MATGNVAIPGIVLRNKLSNRQQSNTLSVDRMRVQSLECVSRMVKDQELLQQLSTREWVSGEKPQMNAARVEICRGRFGVTMNEVQQGGELKQRIAVCECI